MPDGLQPGDSFEVLPPAMMVPTSASGSDPLHGIRFQGIPQTTLRGCCLSSLVYASVLWRLVFLEVGLMEQQKEQLKSKCGIQISAYSI